MNDRPYATALTLALCTIIGFVGLMVFDNALRLVFLAAAAIPALWGTANFVRERLKSSRDFRH